MKKTFIFAGLILILSISVFAQAKKKTAKKPVKKTTTAVVAKPITKTTEEFAPTTVPPKKNERPEEQPVTSQETEPKKKNQADKNSANTKPAKIKYPYVYEFSQPNFVVNHIIIEHDEKGKGTITFEKRDFGGEALVDPLQLSQITLDKLNSIFQTLNFLDSTEEYQSPTRDYGHLGNYTVTLRKDAKERTAKYNWTENKDAKALTDEYRKISEQFVWYFDMNISRENQPLEAPSLVDGLDSLIKRDEISDPSQMLPYLKELSNDERIPLLGRNKVLRIIKEIEKKVSKK